MSQINIDLNKELTDEQYKTEEYIVGKHDGMWNMIGVVQRAQSKGCSIDLIIDQMFEIAQNFDNIQQKSR